MVRLAALLTCHNRREQTMACLSALFESARPPATLLDVVLVDDGSVDGTAVAVRASFSEVQVLQGDGTLYWAGGMRLAYAEALKRDYDFYLFLNDDTVIESDALTRLFATYEEIEVRSKRAGAIVGTTRDPDSHRPTYGGLRRVSSWRSMRLELLTPAAYPIECDSMNTNCVLVPREAALDIGNFDDAFRHRIADIDYGLRMRSAGFSNWVAPGFIGTCADDHRPEASWVDPSTPLRERFRQVTQVKGLPWREWMVFTRRHGGLFWPAFWIWPYVKILLTSSARRG